MSEEHLRLLLAPGSSLGGARPKAAAVDSNGSLAIARFPHKGDEYNIELWSCLALELARKAGIRVPSHRMTTVDDQQVLLVTRFDRNGKRRIPFLSALSMIDASDNETHSYLELVDAIRQHGAEVREDLRECGAGFCSACWCPMSTTTSGIMGFCTILQSAVGGFLLRTIINPVPVDVKPRILSMMIDDRDNSASFDLAIEVGAYFGLENNEMKVIARRSGQSRFDPAWRGQMVRGFKRRDQ